MDQKLPFFLIKDFLVSPFAFTLIEIMVVIAIIGILTAVTWIIVRTRPWTIDDKLNFFERG